MTRTLHAVITGGDRGIGLGIARGLLDQGASSITLIGRDEEALHEAQKTLQTSASTLTTVRTMQVDLSSTAETIACAQSLANEEIPWNCFVHSAGNPPEMALSNMPLDFFRRTFTIHVDACFVLAQALSTGMKDQGWGRIITIGSTAGQVAFRDHGAYSPAKAALTMLTKSMALEWGGYGITANTIAPTVILTKLGQQVWGEHPDRAAWIRHKIPTQRLGEVSDVVNAALFLAAESSDFINGSVIQCDGGQTTTVADGPPA